MNKIVLLCLIILGSQVRLWSFEIYSSTLWQQKYASVYYGSSKILNTESFLDQAILFSDDNILLSRDGSYYFYFSAVLDITNRLQNPKIAFQSSLAEVGVSGPIVQGLFFDIGKKKIKSGTGLFKSPSDFFGFFTGVNRNRTAGSSAKFMQGLIGVGLEAYLGRFTINNYFSPRLTWDMSQKAWQYLSSEQEKFQNLLTLDLNAGNTDYELRVHFADYTNDSEWDFGFNGSTILSEALSIHLDAGFYQRQDQITLLSGNNFSVRTNEIHWIPKILVGANFQLDQSLSFIMEYFFNGRGLENKTYYTTISNTVDLYRNTQSPNAFVTLLSYGDFEFSRHYLMARLSKSFINEKWNATLLDIHNLQDGSGYFSMAFQWSKDSYRINLSTDMLYGAQYSEFGMVPDLWKIKCELEVFLL